MDILQYDRFTKYLCGCCLHKDCIVHAREALQQHDDQCPLCAGKDDETLPFTQPESIPPGQPTTTQDPRMAEDSDPETTDHLRGPASGTIDEDTGMSSGDGFLTPPPRKTEHRDS